MWGHPPQSTHTGQFYLKDKTIFRSKQFKKIYTSFSCFIPFASIWIIYVVAYSGTMFTVRYAFMRRHKENNYVHKNFKTILQIC